MKKFFFPLFALTCSAFHAISADLIVEEFGTAPTYASITAAVAASVDGDRIIIKNRAGDIPWIENITISKSLTFLSYTNNVQFVVQGTYTINAADGRQVNIVGMKNTSGGIQAGTTSGTARGTKIAIMDSWLVAGSISLNNTVFDCQIVGNQMDAGSLTMVWGNIIGNQIANTTTSSINITSALTTAPTDTCYIVGNRILDASFTGILLDARHQVYHCKNNFVKCYNPIQISKGNAQAIPNLVYNNTCVNTSCGAGYLGNIYILNLVSGSVWEIMNNVMDYTSTSCGQTYAINLGSGLGGATINGYYNHVDAAFTLPIDPIGWTFLGNNTTNSTIATNANTGVITSGSPLNGGNPAAPYYDLDLTIGDAGAYGGSYTQNNFFPLFTGAARVYFVKFPFNVRQGNTLATKAFGFDR
jgi:hypothetical protein